VSGIFDIKMERGDTFRADFTRDTAGTPSDFTGCTAQFLVYGHCYGHGASVGTVTVGPEAGTLHLSLTPEETCKLPDRATYRIRVTYPSGDVFTVLEGRIIVND
jgi:hypothetical protein